LNARSDLSAVRSGIEETSVVYKVEVSAHTLDECTGKTSAMFGRREAKYKYLIVRQIF
jgi:hypothetical protein